MILRYWALQSDDEDFPCSVIVFLVCSCSLLERSATPKIPSNFQLFSRFQGFRVKFQILKSWNPEYTWSHDLKYQEMYEDLSQEASTQKSYKVVWHKICDCTLCSKFTVNKWTIYEIYSKFFKIPHFKISWDLRDFKEAVWDFKELQSLLVIVCRLFL